MAFQNKKYVLKFTAKREKEKENEGDVMKQKFTTKQITQTALLLAICIASQFLKNLSVYLTGPVVNAVLLIALLTVGLVPALIIAIITPVTAFFITGSPIMAAMPAMFPVIMLGNAILVLVTFVFSKKTENRISLYIGMGLGSICKAAFMWIMTSFVVFPLFSNNLAGFLPKPEALPKVLAAAKLTFSVTQLITALTGSILAAIILVPLRKYMKNGD